MKLVEVLDLVRETVQGAEPSNAHFFYHLSQLRGHAPDLEVPLPIQEVVVEVLREVPVEVEARPKRRAKPEPEPEGEE